MARSYKLAVYKDNITKADKKMASKAVRRYKGEIPDGGAFKKLYCSYDIHDFIIDCSFGKIEDVWWDDNRKIFGKNGRLYIWK